MPHRPNHPKVSREKSGKQFSGLKNAQVGKTLFRVEKYSSRENTFQG